MLNVILWICPKCSTPHDHLPWCCLFCGTGEHFSSAGAGFTDDRLPSEATETPTAQEKTDGQLER